MKKIFAICFCILLLLTGCGNSGTPDTTAAPVSQGEGVTFTWGRPLEAVTLTEEAWETWSDEEYTRRTGNVRSSVQFVYDSSFIWAQQAADEIPTVFQMDYDDAQMLIRSDTSRSIQELLDERGWTQDMWNEELVQYLVDENGEMHGIPATLQASGLLCNRAVFAEAGLVDDQGNLRYPTTWEEVLEMATVITENTDKVGLYISCNDMYGSKNIINIAWCYGAELTRVDASGKVISQLNHDGVAQTLKLYRELVRRVAVNTNTFMTNSDYCVENVATGLAGMCFCQGQLPRELAKDTQVNMEDLVVVPMPVGPGGNSIMATGNCYWFSPTATDDQVRAALDYIEAFGYSPVWNEDQALKEQQKLQEQTESLGRYLPELRPVKTEYQTEYLAMVEENADAMDPAYRQLFQAALEPGRLRTEMASDLELYRFLLMSVQELSTNPKLDIQTYLDQLSLDYQQILDTTGPNS